MVAHYAALKRAHDDCLLLYRVGEFYEILMDDAKTVSQALNLQLTRRKQKDTDGVPMCGIPASSLDASVKRLLRAGRKVAVCEQAPSPGAERPLCVVTMGTSVDDSVLQADRNNHLACIACDGIDAAFAWVDLSTGEMATTLVPLGSAGAALAKIGPAEILAPRSAFSHPQVAAACADHGCPRTECPEPPPDGGSAGRLAAFFGIADARPLGNFSPLEAEACACLLDYAASTLGVPPASVGFPRRAVAGEAMEIDQATLSGLNVLGTPSGREGSLLSAIDRTVTPPGARLLVRQLTAPLLDPKLIGRRLEMVRALVDGTGVRTGCRRP